MDQKIIDLYDDFIHGGMNRRDFLERLTAVVGMLTGVYQPTAGDNAR